MTDAPRHRADPEAPVVALLASAAQGDRDAFARLFDDTVPRVFGLVLRVVRDPALAEQVTRDVFIRAWQQAGTYDESAGTVLCWLLTAAHRCAVDSVRSAEETGSTTTHLVPVATHPTPTAEDHQALALLEPAQREAVELAYFGGYTHAEVAQLVGAPRGGALLLLRDGLRQLRAGVA